MLLISAEKTRRKENDHDRQNRENYRLQKKFSDALKVCLAESGIATAANLHKEMDARGYPVNDSTVRRYVSGNVFPPETAFGVIQSILEPNITKESMDRLERTYLAVADERGYAVEKDATEQDAETNLNEETENPWRVAPKTREGYNEPWFDRTTLYGLTAISG